MIIIWIIILILILIVTAIKTMGIRIIVRIIAMNSHDLKGWSCVAEVATWIPRVHIVFRKKHTSTRVIRTASAVGVTFHHTFCLTLRAIRGSKLLLQKKGASQDLVMPNRTIVQHPTWLRSNRSAWLQDKILAPAGLPRPPRRVRSGEQGRPRRGACSGRLLRSRAVPCSKSNKPTPRHWHQSPWIHAHLEILN